MGGGRKIETGIARKLLVWVFPTEFPFHRQHHKPGAKLTLAAAAAAAAVAIEVIELLSRSGNIFQLTLLMLGLFQLCPEN